MAWDKTLPSNSTKIRNYPTVLTANWQAIEENDTAVVATSINQWAIHLIDRSTIGGSNTPARLDDINQLYTRSDGTTNQLFMLDSENPANDIQMTRSTEVTDAANGQTCLPGGILMQWFTVTASPGNIAHTFPTAFPASIYSINFTPYLNSTSNNDVDVYIIQSTIAITGFSTRNSTGQTFTLYVQAIGK